jgi:undecaprenyl diphosphate synthase
MPDPLVAGKLPRHIAVIMDGNGRWAKLRNQPRMFGHDRGAHVTRELVVECARLGIEALTIYSFSLENWKRPAVEVEFLMELCVQRLEAELPLLMDNNVRLVHIGRRHELPQPLLDKLDETVRLTAGNTGMTLALAWNYGSRLEITGAVRAIAADVAAGKISLDDIDEKLISDRLDTAGLPDPDLLIRTGGDLRVSNFLLWQISYAELWVTPTLWPDFSPAHLQEALAEYSCRQRRFGGV